MRTFYRKFYRYELSEEQIDRILNESNKCKQRGDGTAIFKKSCKTMQTPKSKCKLILEKRTLLDEEKRRLGVSKKNRRSSSLLSA